MSTGSERASIGLLYEISIAQGLTGVSLGIIRKSDASFDGFDLWLTDATGSPRDQLMQYADVDFLLPGDADLVVVQCKATGSSDLAMSLADIREILVAGSKQLRTLRDAGETRPVAAFLLVTNRSLGPSVASLNSDLWEESKGRPPQPRLTPLDPIPQSFGKNKVTVEGWCRRSCKKGVAPHVEDLAVRLRHVQLNSDRIAAALDRSLQSLGLLPSEISEVVQAWRGALVSPLGDDLDVVRQKMLDELTGGYAPRNLRFSGIADLTASSRDQAWESSNLVGTHDAPSPDLLRRRLLGNILLQCQEAEAPDCAGVVLIAEGGMGKTRAAYRAAILASSPGRQFLYAPWESAPSDALEPALKPLFTSLRRARGDGSLRLLQRLEEAQWESAESVTLWVVVPDFDRVSGGRLRSQLVALQSVATQHGSRLRVRFLLTCRKYAWDVAQRGTSNNSQRWKEVFVPGLEEEEVGMWLSDRRIGSDRFDVEPLHKDDTMVVRSGGTDPFRDLGLSHPLAFSALHEVLESRGQLAPTFSPTLASDRAEFYSVARQQIVDRLAKHAGDGNIPLDEVEAVFDALSQRRDDLATVEYGEWPGVFFGMVSKSCADTILVQAEEVGVLVREGRQRRWRLDWYPSGVVGA